MYVDDVVLRRKELIEVSDSSQQLVGQEGLPGSPLSLLQERGREVEGGWRERGRQSRRVGRRKKRMRESLFNAFSSSRPSVCNIHCISYCHSAIFSNKMCQTAILSFCSTNLDQVEADDGGAESLQAGSEVQGSRRHEGSGSVDWEGGRESRRKGRSEKRKGGRKPAVGLTCG